MSPERAFNTVIDAAVLHWAADTKRAELREALDQVLVQLSDNTVRRALALKWRPAKPAEHQEELYQKHDAWRPKRVRS
jgi:hypothetical protein